MKLNRPRVPIGLPIATVIMFLLGLAAGPIIDAVVTEEQLATTVILNAIPFICIFISIILLFVSIIWLVATALNNNVPEPTYRTIERIIIGGIVLGILGMFQPWSITVYRYGFMLLFIATLAFILWSHVIPRSSHADLVASLASEAEQAGS